MPTNDLPMVDVLRLKALDGHRLWLRFTDGKPLHMIFASLGTKDPAGMLAPFTGVAAYVLTVPIPGHASFGAAELAEIATAQGFAADAYASVEEAIAAIAPGSRLLIFGSLYLAGVVLAANDQLPD